MRVAMVHSDLPPGESGGGVRHQVAGLAKALTARGHEVTAHVFAGIADRRGYDIVALPGARWADGSRIRRTIAAPMAFAAARYGPVDIIHAHGDSHLLVRRRTAVVRTFYGSARDEGRAATDLRRRALERYHYAGERLARRLADRTVGISTTTQESVGPLDAIIPCGVDLEQFRPGAKADRPTVVFIGQMAGRKRGSLVQRVFQDTVLAQVPDAELILIAADASDAQNIRAVRSATNDELAELLRRAWVFTMPSVYEGFGVPYVEAMASGTAVVTTPNAGSREIFGDGASGGELVSEPNLGGAMASVLLDEQQRRELERAGRAASASYAWDVIAARYEELYQGLVHQ